MSARPSLAVNPQRMRRKLRELMEKAQTAERPVRETAQAIAEHLDRKHVQAVTPAYRIRGGR